MPARVSRGFLKLVDGATLRDFRIEAYGDADEAGPIVRGVGNLIAGTIVTGAGRGLDLVGTVAAVDYRSATKIALHVDGDGAPRPFCRSDPSLNFGSRMCEHV